MSTILVLIVTLLVWNHNRILKVIGRKIEQWKLRSIARKSVKNSNIEVSGLYIYPVKSLRAVSLTSTSLDHLGLHNDRRLMIVRCSIDMFGKKSWRFLTQRQCPSLATIAANYNYTNTEICLSAYLPNGTESERREVRVDVTDDHVLKCALITAGIWDESVTLADVGDDEVVSFIFDIIRKDLCYDDDDNSSENNSVSKDDFKLVSILPSYQHSRPADKSYLPLAALQSTGTSPNVSLTDGYPILIANEASLEELNRRLTEKQKNTIPMSRFRPNIVVRGAKAFDEDNWKAIEINGSIFHIVKGCPRCKQSCTDQLSGERSDEPLSTLSDFRAFGKNGDVYFAQNVVMQDNRMGELKIGDKIRILTRGNPVWNRETVQAE